MQTNESTQLERLMALQANPAQKSNLTAFNDLVGVYVGTQPKEHFPKLRDEAGKALKDKDGKDLRSEKADGLTYTFSEFGTAKMIKVVLPKRLNFKILTAYKISGRGYDIKGSMYFLEADGMVQNY